MKTYSTIAGIFVLILFIACSGSDTYRGAWKATDSDGNKMDILFDAKNFTITKEDGDSTNYTYSQNQVNVTNGIETYGIKLGDGRTYQLNFPIANDESVGIIADGNGGLVYTISRDDYITYDEIYDLD